MLNEINGHLQTSVSVLSLTMHLCTSILGQIKRNLKEVPWYFWWIIVTAKNDVVMMWFVCLAFLDCILGDNLKSEFLK